MGYFTLVNQRIADLVGTPIVRPGLDGEASWGDITADHIYRWNGALHPLYLALQLAGYTPDVTHFRISAGLVLVLDLAEGTVATVSDTQRADVTIEYSSMLGSAPGRSTSGQLGLPLDTSSLELVAEFELEGLASEFIPQLTVDQTGGEVSFDIHGAVNEGYDGGEAAPHYERFQDRLSESYPILITSMSMPIVRLIETSLVQRWTVSHSGKLSDHAWASPNLVSSVYEGPSVPLAPNMDVDVSCGLLWIFNPEFWQFDDSIGNADLIADIALKLWTGFEKRGFSTQARTGYAYDLTFRMETVHFSALANKLFGLHKHRAKRFFEQLELVIAESDAGFPKILVDLLPTLPYVELIMLLVNFGIIRIPLLGGFDAESVEQERDPVDVLFIGEGLPHTVEIRVFGGMAARLVYASTVNDYLSDSTGAANFSLTDLICWEFHEREQVVNEDGTSPPHRLVIVAAPGIAILETENPPTNVKIQIIRVQDPALVPTIFTPIDTAMYYAPWQEEMLPPGIEFLPNTNPELQGPETSENVSAFQITPLADQAGDMIGMTIEYPSAELRVRPGQALDVFKLKLTLKVDKYSPNQRFDYEIIRNWEDGEGAWFFGRLTAVPTEQFTLVAHRTPGVSSEVVTHNPARNGSWGNYDWVRWYLYEVSGPEASDPTVINLIPYADDVLAHVRAHRYVSKNGTITTRATMSRETLLGYWIDQHTTPDDNEIERFLDWYFFAGEHSAYDGTALTVSNHRSEYISDENPGIGSSVPHGQITLVEAFPYSNSAWEADSSTRILVDIAIGFIPVVGDAVDIAELVNVMVTGQDRWGNKVSNNQFMLMAGCTALPFVGNGAARVFRGGHP